MAEKSQYSHPSFIMEIAYSGIWHILSYLKSHYWSNDCVYDLDQGPISLSVKNVYVFIFKKSIGILWLNPLLLNCMEHF